MHGCQHSTAQHSTAQHSTAQHSTAQHSTAQHSTAEPGPNPVQPAIHPSTKKGKEGQEANLQRPCSSLGHFVEAFLFCVQAVTLWLQYMTLLAGVNIPAPGSLHWVFSAANFAFTSVTSGALSTDCLLSGHVTAALQRILVHLAVPVLLLALLSIMQLCWSAPLQPGVSIMAFGCFGNCACMSSLS